MPALTVITDTGRFTLPRGIGDIPSYRRWTQADNFPGHYRIWWLRGEVWADLNEEQVFTHNVVKTEITSVLHQLARSLSLGDVFSDGLLLTNFDADISGNPDATFISYEAIGAERVRLNEGKQGGYTEVQGAPDMVLEVVSDSSEHKDTVTLKQAYSDAGVREYWLVDARKVPPTFEIWRRSASGYTATPKRNGWGKSPVFGKAFRLRQGQNALKHPVFYLDVK